MSSVLALGSGRRNDRWVHGAASELFRPSAGRAKPQSFKFDLFVFALNTSPNFLFGHSRNSNVCASRSLQSLQVRQYLMQSFF